MLPHHLEIVSDHIIENARKNNKGDELPKEVISHVNRNNANDNKGALHMRVRDTIRKYRSKINQNNHTYAYMLKAGLVKEDEVADRKAKKKKTNHSTNLVVIST